MTVSNWWRELGWSTRQGGKSRRYELGVCVSVAVALAAGCASDQIKANQTQLAQQQAELDRLKQDVAALQAANSNVARAAAPANGACDESVAHEASRKGGERFAASDFTHAVAYYQDAVSACPADARAQLNLARAYESLGDSTQARSHYQIAAQSAGGDASLAKEAQDALTRLHP